MRKTFLLLLMTFLVYAVGWAETATFTEKDKSSGTLTGAPSGVTATVSGPNQVSNSGWQVTDKYNAVITFSGFSADYKLTEVSVTYNTNKSKGSAPVKVKLGDKELTTTTTTLKYSGSADGTSAKFSDNLGVTETQFDGKSALVVTIGKATTNSIYVVSVSVTYEATGGDTPQPTTYDLSASVTGNGALDFKVDGSSVTKAAEGATVSVTATPSEHYSLSSWAAPSNVSDWSASGNTATFTMPAEAVTVGATFTENEKYAINITAPANGTLSTNPSGSAYEGETVTVTATPSEGYGLSEIQVDGTAISGNTFTMPASNVTVSATFAKSTSTTETATFIFNTTAGLSALGISAPSKSSGTDIANNTYKSNEISFTSTDGGTTNTRIWNSNGSYTLRLYNNDSNHATITISADEGCLIKKIEFNASALNVSADPTGLTQKKWEGSANKVVFTTTGGCTISTITVTYTKPAQEDVDDLYIFGNTMNGLSDWDVTQGTKMTYSSSTGRYSANVYFNGTDNYFQFAKGLAESGTNADNWSGLTGRLYPDTNGANVDVNNYNMDGTVPLYITETANGYSFKAPAGIYNISVDLENKRCYVEQITPTVTILPADRNVDTGAKASASSNLYTLLSAINSEIAETDVTVQVSGSEDGTFANEYEFVADDAPTKTIYAKAAYGNIVATANADFNITVVAVNRYKKVTSTADLVSGAKYILVYESKGAINGGLSDNKKFFNSVTDGVSVADGVATVSSSSVLPLTFKQVDGTATAPVFEILLDASTKLGQSAAGNGNLEENGKNTKWNITVNSDEASISNATLSGNIYIRYNSSAPRFTTYASNGQSAIALYIDETDAANGYALTVDNTITNGTVTTLPNVKVLSGESVNVTATPSEGYELSKIQVDGTAISGNTFTMPAAAVTVSATFTAQAGHTVSVIESKLDTEEGDVTLSATTGTVTNAYNLADVTTGATVTVTATPAAGYVLNSIDLYEDDQTATKINNITISGDGNVRTFTMPNYDVYVSPNFAAIPTYTITLNQPLNGEGTISADKATAAAGETVTLTATAADGYRFSSWTVLDGDSENVTVTGNTFTMPASNVEVDATFEEYTPAESTTYTLVTSQDQIVDDGEYIFVTSDKTIMASQFTSSQLLGVDNTYFTVDGNTITVPESTEAYVVKLFNIDGKYYFNRGYNKFFDGDKAEIEGIWSNYNEDKEMNIPDQYVNISINASTNEAVIFKSGSNTTTKLTYYMQSQANQDNLDHFAGVDWADITKPERYKTILLYKKEAVQLYDINIPEYTGGTTIVDVADNKAAAGQKVNFTIEIDENYKVSSWDIYWMAPASASSSRLKAEGVKTKIQASDIVRNEEARTVEGSFIMPAGEVTVDINFKYAPGDVATGINSVNAEGKAVKAVRVYNVNGAQLREAQSGVNIIVTEYMDGTTSTRKAIKN